MTFRHPAWLLVILLSLVHVPVCVAQNEVEPRIALHVAPHGARSGCTAATGAPTALPCSDFATVGSVGVGYDVYVVAVRNPPGGIAGVVFGIDYDGGPGSGVDAFGWTVCGDLQFPSAGWPAARSGNVITWSWTTNCQETEVGGRIQAVAGFFYVYAYDDDTFRITERLSVPEPDLGISDCASQGYPISPTMAGWVSFNASGGGSAWNPCGPNAPCEVSPTILEFGIVAYGGFSERSFAVTNRFTEAFSISPVPVGAGYSIVGGGGDTLLQPGESVVITVRFTPTAEGEHPGYIDIQGGTCAPVTCSGGAQSACNLIPSLLDFGSVVVGEEAIEPLMIISDGSGIISGVVSFDAPEFSVASGDSLVHVDVGDTLFLPIRFVPSAVGPVTGTLTVTGTSCGGVICRGEGITDCGVSPSPLDFGEVPLGASVDRTLRITNHGSVRLEGSVLLNCAEFQVISGGGAYGLEQGESRDVTIRFTPAEAGSRACYLVLDGGCDPVLLAGQGFLHCGAGTTFLDFGEVAPGEFGELGFTIANPTQAPLSGTVMSSGLPFEVTVGGGDYTILPGESHPVTVRFAPTIGGLRIGAITYSPLCPPVECLGLSVVPGTPTQRNAKIALHLTTVAFKNQCTTNSPSLVPCDEFLVSGQTTTSYAAYAIVADGNVDYGIGAVEFGIRYDEALGSGVDMFQWNLCADWESPGAGWPESGGRNVIRWDVSSNCQRSYHPELGFEGVQAVAGWFYVYAYGTDSMDITAPSASEAPTVEDCGGRRTSLSWVALARLRFGAPAYAGFNPCTYVPSVPVELLTLSARRMDGGVEIAWEIAGEVSDVLGFRVHRETRTGERLAVHEDLVGGARSYAVRDPDAPRGEARYWLAEYARTGEVSWHGPALLEASPVVGPVLAQNHPNPFSLGTRIAYRVDAEGPVSLRVFDLSGREVARLVEGTQEPGAHELNWDGRDVTGQRVRAGIYLYRLETDDRVTTRKMVVLR